MTRALYLYYAGVDLEARFGSAEKAFEYSESLRSRGFLEQMGTEMALRLPGLTGRERDAVREITARIEAQQEILDSYKGVYIETERDTKQFADAGIALAGAEKELAALDGLIGGRIPQYAALRNFRPVDSAGARAFCGNDRVVLEYVLWDNSIDYTLGPLRPTINSYCLVLTRDGVRPVTLDHTFDYLEAVNDLRDAVINDPDKTRGITVEPGNADRLEERRNALYARLVKPVLPYLPGGVKNIVIVPDGNLANLPFDLLRENARSPDFGQSYTISLSPSVSVSVMAAKTGARGTGPLLAFGGALYDRNGRGQDRGLTVLDEEGAGKSAAGNPAGSPAEWYRAELAKFKRNYWPNLAGTEAEVQRLRGLSFQRGRPTVFTGKEVSEGQLKKMSAGGTLKNYPLIHFALHGYFCGEVPAYSSIVFSETGGMIPPNGEDGYLTLPEIAVLNLDANMVMLSACQTGQVNLKRGDGMVGIARSFLVAGAENVGVSLWSISDEATVEFMTRLYRKVIEQKMNFRDAYSAVKNEFRGDSRWSHPFYWAAFTMYE
jgi:CHAT domain-containing protein